MDKYKELKQAVNQLVRVYDDLLNEEVPPEKLTPHLIEVTLMVDNLIASTSS